MLVAAVACVVVIIAALMVIWAAQRRLMYFPIAAVPPVGQYGSNVAAVSFATADDLTLSAW
jgi:hypothetical protein